MGAGSTRFGRSVICLVYASYGKVASASGAFPAGCGGGEGHNQHCLVFSVDVSAEDAVHVVWRDHRPFPYTDSG